MVAAIFGVHYTKYSQDVIATASKVALGQHTDILEKTSAALCVNVRRNDLPDYQNERLQRVCASFLATRLRTDDMELVKAVIERAGGQVFDLEHFLSYAVYGNLRRSQQQHAISQTQALTFLQDLRVEDLDPKNPHARVYGGEHELALVDAASKYLREFENWREEKIKMSWANTLDFVAQLNDVTIADMAALQQNRSFVAKDNALKLAPFQMSPQRNLTEFTAGAFLQGAAFARAPLDRDLVSGEPLSPYLVPFAASFVETAFLGRSNFDLYVGASVLHSLNGLFESLPESEVFCGAVKSLEVGFTCESLSQNLETAQKATAENAQQAAVALSGITYVGAQKGSQALQGSIQMSVMPVRRP